MSFQFFNPAKKLTITHGDLPHWEQEGSTYFITWRTIDPIPREVWLRWTHERDTWLRDHGIDPAEPDWRSELEGLAEAQRVDFRRFSRTLETELDACHGACPLRDPSLGRIVQKSLHFRDGTAYLLGDYIIMPNHVHLIVGGMPRGAMLKQVASWKKWTALEINRQLNRQGRFWQDESFDHLIRNEISHAKLCRYIAENPTRACLRPGEFIHHRSPHSSGPSQSDPHQSGPLSPLSGTQAEKSRLQPPEAQSPHPFLSDSPSHLRSFRSAD